MKKGTYIRLKKLSACPNPEAPTPEWTNFIQGQDNGNVSLPVDYTIEGILEADVEPSKSVFVYRTLRNGERVEGHFGSSPIQTIKPRENGAILTTLNSIYLIETLSDSSNKIG